MFYGLQWLFAPALLNFHTVLGWESTCSSFTLHNRTDVTVFATTYYAANATVDLATHMSSIDTNALPGFCRVQLVITTNTTANSSCNTEVWLPDEWNGRVLTVGNGGFAGGVNVADLGYLAIAQGFAGISTDTGHTGGVRVGTWGGPHNDNAIVDWGWRALHLSVISGKEVTNQYYDQIHNKSYYLGCSTGGRQGLKEIQTFPEDFDGVVVGSPANWQTHLQDWSIHMNLDVRPASRFINASQWIHVVHPEVLRQCDALDGAYGIINDPRFCNFRPETLTCRPGQDPSTCLTIPQIEAARRIYADYYETNQTWIFGSYYPGGEVAFPDALVTQAPFEISQEWFRYFVLNDTEWTIEQYNASLIPIADEIDPGQSNAIDPNLTAFAGPEHNGKVLHYVGWADQLISPGNSLHWYESVYAFTQAHTELKIDDFYRMFTAPGMNHW
ncbi:uncharacterized protein FIBRA_06485 [Fibroporia radiculosa]|uniref:Carboxylic ester hydrolase n=1 Tax=Fibroporia radiculosa TaxID=599839 RepID=J4H437_9APHY|nr:uncharacterized protein FIBRA_06485 [Fibroporia radiculosa]CCM04314.1 predicted protein [Fibroporia radiculosa]